MKRLLVSLAATAALALAGNAYAVATYNYEFKPNPTDVGDLDHGYVYDWTIQTDWAKLKNETLTGATIKIANLDNWQTEVNYLFIDLLAGNTPPGTGWSPLASSNPKDVQYKSVPTDVVGVDFFSGQVVQNSGTPAYQYDKTLDTWDYTKNMRIDTFVDTNGPTTSSNTSFYKGTSIDYSISTTEANTYAEASADKKITSGNLKGDVTFSNSASAIAYEYKLNANQVAILDKLLTNQGGKISLGFDADCHFFNNGVSFDLQTEAAPVPEPGTLLLLGSGLLGLGGIGRRRKAS